MTVGLSLRPFIAAVLAASAVAFLASPAPVVATTIGPDLSTPPTNVFSCNIVGGCTYSQGTPSYVSPISGTVVGWIVRGSSGPLTFRIINGNTGGALSEVRTSSTYGIECFSANLPINAGERIGVDLPAGFVSNMGVRQPAGSSVDGWTPQLGNGDTVLPNNAYPNFELLLDAVIQPVSGPPASCPPGGQPTGGRGAALKRCKKKHKKALNKKRKHHALTKRVKKQLGKKLRKCKHRANQLPV